VTSEPSSPPRPRSEASLLEALLPVVALVALLGASVAAFGDAATAGPTQVSLLVAAGMAGVSGVRRGIAWQALQDGIAQAIGVAIPALLILLLVGALIGSWILSGTVPYLILLGATWLAPAWFYAGACLICALVALSVGSSWSTAGTVGVALMGSAAAMDVSPAITAGAIISGAYFGDKLSPLSETTNLSAAVGQADLFAHIRHMARTTLPAMLLALAAFALLGLGGGHAGDDAFARIAEILNRRFALGPLTLLPVALLVYLSVRGYPPLPVIALAAVAGLACALALQWPAAVALAPEGLDGAAAALAGCWAALATGYAAESGVAVVDALLNRGGMASMLGTIWLILCALTFGGVMEAAGLLERLVRGLLALARGARGLVVTTLATSLTTNLLAADQYLSIVVPGRLYQPAYQARGLAPVNLSRALEDGGTLTSVLVPWNTCGAYMAATLGVATLDYLPWCLFNLLAFGIAVLWAASGRGIVAAEIDRSAAAA